MLLPNVDSEDSRADHVINAEATHPVVYEWVVVCVHFLVVQLPVLPSTFGTVW